MKKVKICILYSDTGGGHKSAANAVIAAANRLIDSKYHQLSGMIDFCAENVIEQSHPANKAMVDFYNFILRYHQPSMIHYFNFINKYKIDNNEYIYNFTKDFAYKKLKELDSDVIISVHPMLNNYTARALRESGLRDKTKFYVVVTDPNEGLWNGWASCDADLIFVPNELAANKLVELGCDKSKIKIVGMPIHPRFIDKSIINKFDYKVTLGLNPNLFTLCINAGWAGGGNMLKILKEFVSAKVPAQALFICGNNKKLFNKAQKIAAKSAKKIQVLPYCDNLNHIMEICDLMVTKAGGLTVYEALAKNVPIAFDNLTKAMPQEIGTIRNLTSQNRAFAINKLADVHRILNKMVANSRLDETDNKVQFDCWGSYLISEFVIKSIIESKNIHNVENAKSLNISV